MIIINIKSLKHLDKKTSTINTTYFRQYLSDVFWFLKSNRKELLVFRRSTPIFKAEYIKLLDSLPVFYDRRKKTWVLEYCNKVYYPYLATIFREQYSNIIDKVLPMDKVVYIKKRDDFFKLTHIEGDNNVE